MEITVIDENGEDITSQFSSQRSDKMSIRIYFNNEIEDVSVDDEVSTTTSTFDYDNVAGTFASDLKEFMQMWMWKG